MSHAPNLTREQASQRAKTLTTESYEVTIDLTDGAGGPGEKTFATRSVIRFSSNVIWISSSL